jgi:hypothetical protein
MNSNLFLLINKTILIGFTLDVSSNIYLFDNVFFKQFTIWNLISMYIEPTNNQVTMNNITIFIIFHLMFVLDHTLIYKIPKRCNISLPSFCIINIILHILPFTYSLIYLKNNVLNITAIDIFDNLVYLFVWSVYVRFDYSIYSIDSYYYKYLFLVYFICLGFYKNDFKLLK